jgi:hypothetical protein
MVRRLTRSNAAAQELGSQLHVWSYNSLIPAARTSARAWRSQSQQLKSQPCQREALLLQDQHNCADSREWGAPVSVPDSAAWGKTTNTATGDTCGDDDANDDRQQRSIHDARFTLAHHGHRQDCCKHWCGGANRLRTRGKPHMIRRTVFCPTPCPTASCMCTVLCTGDKQAQQPPGVAHRAQTSMLRRSLMPVPHTCR